MSISGHDECSIYIVREKLSKALCDSVSFGAIVNWIYGGRLGSLKIACWSYLQVEVRDVRPVKAVAVLPCDSS